MSFEDNEDNLFDASSLLSNLQQRADSLLDQVKAFQACLISYNRQNDVEIRAVKRGVESEVKALKTASRTHEVSNGKSLHDVFEAEELETKRLHSLRSSNLPFYEAVWAVARQSEAVVALGKRVYCQMKTAAIAADNFKTAKSLAKAPSRNDKAGAVVDVMAKDGLEWIKVSTITERRLLFEMAKEGWETYDDKDGSEKNDSEEDMKLAEDKHADSNQLELVKLANVLHAAARETRIRFKHPQVHFILPKIHEGVYDDVDAVIADIRSIGVAVTCGEDHDNFHDSVSRLQHLTLHPDNLNHNHNSTSAPSPPSPDLLRLLPSSNHFSPPPTPTLNIDCTVLLALISDISHIPQSSLPPHPPNISGHYHKAITRQIATETTVPLLPTELYPLITDTMLICTSHAAQRMREIVQTMGTESERQRAAIILAEDTYRDCASGALRKALEAYTCHAVPVTLRLPLEVVDVDIDAVTGLEGVSLDAETLSSQDLHVLTTLSRSMSLSTINKSVFLYGWRAGLVTVTSNRAVANGLVRAIGQVLDEEEVRTEAAGGGGTARADVGVEERGFRGPLIYVCETARSLIGKEKQGT